jgi:hypothetical protein
VSHDDRSNPFLGPRCLLTPLLPEHYVHLHEITLEPNVANRWEPDLAGGGFEGWVRRLADGVLCQYGVHVPTSTRPVDGLVRCYGANFRHGTAQIAVFMSSRTHNTGIGLGHWDF